MGPFGVLRGPKMGSFGVLRPPNWVIWGYPQNGPSCRPAILGPEIPKPLFHVLPVLCHFWTTPCIKVSRTEKGHFALYMTQLAAHPILGGTPKMTPFGPLLGS